MFRVATAAVARREAASAAAAARRPGRQGQLEGGSGRQVRGSQAHWRYVRLPAGMFVGVIYCYHHCINRRGGMLCKFK